MSKRKRFQRSVSIAVLSSMLLVTGMPFTSLPATQAEALSSTEQSESMANQQNGSIGVSHTPPVWIPEKQDFTVTATVYGNESPITARLTYSMDGQIFDPIELKAVENQTGLYAGDIPVQSLNGSQLNYTIELSDAEGKIIYSTNYSTEIRPVTSLAKQSTGPELLITEMVPDTTNLPKSSTDAYEFVEVYNNTDREINFKDYVFFYNNTDTWKPAEGKDIRIPAHSPIVFWIMNGSNNQLTAEQFNSNYGTSLTEDQQLFRIQGGGGMANGSARSLVIKKLTNESGVVSASYEKSHVKENKGIFFKHPIAGSTQMTVMDDSGKLPATPGVIDPQQAIPPVVDEGSQTTIVHSVPADALPVQDVVVKAQVKNLAVQADGSKAAVKLLYKTPSQNRYTVLTMSPVANSDEYTATIPAAMLVEPQLLYRIQTGSLDQAYSASVQMETFDSSKVPPLLITELVPNTTNIPGTSSDAYEYIEVYNNTDQPIQFKNYSLYYRYPDKGPSADVAWQAEQPNIVIPAQQPVVFWIKNSTNAAYTDNNFNQFYQTNLKPNVTLYSIQSDGMANSGRRALVLKTNTGKEISSAYYDADQAYEGGTKGDETKEDKAITYAYPRNGSNVMIKSGSGTTVPSPGTIEAAQIPSQPLHMEQDNNPPTVTDMTKVTTVDQSNGLELIADAKDNREVTSVELYIRSDKQSEYSRYRLTQDYNDTMYHHTLSSAELIGRKTLEYYFVVSDGVNETQSAESSISITGGASHEPLRLNVKDQDILHGTYILKGTSENAGTPVNLRINDKPVPANVTSGALEHDAYFVFEAVNVDYYFKNAVTMGAPELEDKSILYTFMNPITTYTTLSFPISSERLVKGDNVIYIRAGSKTSPFDQRPEENKDDFEVKNVRLLLADGTEIWDPAYADKEKQLKIGDSPGKSESIGFHFNLSPELLKAKAYAWDTSTVPDGKHQVMVTDGDQQVAVDVLVDNTPPVIKPTVEDNQTYRGQFVIDAQIQDAIAGIDQVIVKLDGKVIDLPVSTSSGKMQSGKHVLQIQATDRVGNKTEKTINFTVPDENPFLPELISPQLNQTNVGTQANLTVKVQDPNADSMDVTFYKGYKFDGQRSEGFKGFLNTSVTEPPKEMVPAGEKAMDTEDYKKIAKVDGTYLVNDSVEQFPYQRFEVKLDPAVKSTDRVEIQWLGKSLEGRKVSLYAWSESEQKWKQLDHVIAGTKDFALNAVVRAGEYANNQIIQVMVQDEISEQANVASSKATPESQDPYDFSFVWMSDTQYYSQSYPHIYQKMVDWIADQKDKMNIKYVIHTGDVVDKADQEYQWIEADKNMKVLENASIPYGVLAGNHDVGHQNNDYTMFQRYFGEQRFINNSVFGGSYDNNRGHYDLVSAGGNDFIIVYMGWGLAEKEIQWMNEIVSKYPERKAILALHEYLLVSNNRSPIADQIFEKVVKPNKNVIAALSGHYHDAELKIDALDDNGDGIPDRNVYQMLADYQGAPEGGLGYMRLMQFDMTNNKLHIKTYSPYLNDYNYYDPATEKGKDEFSLDLGLAPTTKRVATDYIGVKVYTDQEIGSKDNIASGQQASVVWKGLPAKGYQQWYVKAEDGNTGSVLSDIWGFDTGTPSTGEQTPGSGDGGNAGSSNPESASRTQTTVPSETKPSVRVDQGELTLNPAADGSYRVESSLFEQAVASARGGKVVITLEGSKQNDEGQFSLYLPAEEMKKAKSRGNSILISSPSLTVTLSPDAIPQQLGEGNQLILRLNSLKDGKTTQLMNDSLFTPQQYVQTEIGQSVRMYLLQNKVEKELRAFDHALTVEMTLTAEQQKKFQSEYAGVYLVGQDVEYKGGTFKGNVVTFEANQPGVYSIMEYRKSFDDMNNSWASQYVGMLTAKHLIQGIDSENYGPALKVNRGDFITLIMRAAGNTASSPQSAFTDVPAGAYYGSSVAEATRLGIVQGNGSMFRPKDSISREEAAVILMKASEALFNHKPSASTVTKSSFSDQAQVSSWAKEAVERMNTLGIMTGKANLRFDPKGEVTRAELAKMVYELIHLER